MKRATRIFSTLALVVAFLLICYQGLVYLLGRHFGVHYFDDRLLYLVNTMVILLAFMGVLPYFKKIRPLLVLVGFLLMLQGLMLFLGANHYAVVFTSPAKSNTFMLQVDKRTGKATYQRNLYYQFPKLQKVLSKPAKENNYWNLSINADALAYTMSDNYNISWPSDSLAVFTYETLDGGKAQFVRSYDQSTAQVSEEKIIGKWRSQEGQTRLDATSSTYQLQLEDQLVTLDPTYSQAGTSTSRTYTDSQGSALCTVVLTDDDHLFVVSADLNHSTSYQLTRVSQ